MRGAADMLHHIERRQYITKATTVCLSVLEMSIYWEFPWAPWVPWDFHGNWNRQASFMEMEMGMGMT